MGEKVRQNGSYAMVRGSSEKGRAVRNGQMLVACLSPDTSRHGLLPMAMSRSVMMSMTHVATNFHFIDTYTNYFLLFKESILFNF